MHQVNITYCVNIQLRGQEDRVVVRVIILLKQVDREFRDKSDSYNKKLETEWNDSVYDSVAYDLIHVKTTLLELEVHV